jgi:hypothetical protein
VSALYDAGLERERLAAETAVWMRHGLDAERRAKFDADVETLAWHAELPVQAVMTMLRADARTLLLEEVE